MIGALDLFSERSLGDAVQNDIKDIEIAPILLRKGTTKLAMYGLGNIRDERLFQTWKKEKKVHPATISISYIFRNSPDRPTGIATHLSN